MQLSQKLDLRKLLVPELKQSLKILSLPLPDLRQMIDEELVNNPFLEEAVQDLDASHNSRQVLRSPKPIRRVSPRKT